MAFQILGFDSTYKVPRFAAQIIYGAGSVSASQSEMACLCVGLKTSAGSMTADNDVVQVSTTDEVDAYAGAGSQLARMAYKALKVPGVRLYLAAVAEAGSGTAATATLVLSGTWSTAGTWALRVAGELMTGTVNATDTVDDVGAAIAAAIAARPRLPVTAAYTSGSDTLTLTCKNVGAGGRDWLVAWDKSALPSGLVGTLTGSAAAGSNRVRMGASASGTGTEDPTTILTKLMSRRYGRIAVASTDASNAVAKWKPFADAKAVSTVMQYEHLVFGVNSTLQIAKTLAQGTLGGGGTYSGGLNHVRSQVIWDRNCEAHPAELAASKAAVRAVTEGADPVPDYDGLVLPGIPATPLGYESDTPTDLECNDALNAGVTPVRTVGDSARVVRAITSYCLTTAGNAGEERCLDVGDAVMPDYASLDTSILYEGYKALNKYVQADPPVEANALPSGIATPATWNAHLLQRMLDWFRSGWIEDPRENPPVSEFNTVAKRIQSAVPLLVRRVQHQLGVIVRQTSNS